MPEKRSVRISGHATSITLESPFWDELKAIAARRGLTLSALVAATDAARPDGVNLSSALRLYVLKTLKEGT